MHFWVVKLRFLGTVKSEIAKLQSEENDSTDTKVDLRYLEIDFSLLQLLTGSNNV